MLGKIEKLKSINDNFAQITIARVYNEQNPTQIFVRIYMNIVLMASIEIMKKIANIFSIDDFFQYFFGLFYSS